jgi:hypothetical protein
LATPKEAAVNHPNRPDGRLRALYAAAAAGLDIASFTVQAVWIVCLVGLVAVVVSVVAGAYNAIF